MSAVITVGANENGLVRVFALSFDAVEAEALKANEISTKGETPQAIALGCVGLDSTHTEVFPISDLGDMSLADYLAEGAGIQPDAIDPDRLKLAKIEGWVMIVYSSAFGGVAQTISPVQQMTLIGTYPQAGIDWSAPLDLSTPSALPPVDQPEDPSPKKRPSDAAMSGRIATVALLVAFGVVGLMFWVGS